ncbi:MAG: fimbrillin family protein [Bacteroides sp.]|nr:fimbrillin family protein [Bacteroides sp.]
MKKNVCMILAAGLVLGACSNDSEPAMLGNVPAVFTANIGGERVQSRMAGQTWEAGDEIGIFASGATNNTDEQNWKYTYAVGGGSGSWGSDRAFYYKDTEETPATVTFKAYYPWTEGATADGTLTVDASTEDSQKPDGGQKKIDFLFSNKASDVNDAPAPTGSRVNPAVNFQFTHVMSKIEFTLKVEDGDDSSVKLEEVKEMVTKLTGVKSKGTFSLTTGAVTASETETATDIVLTQVDGTAGSKTMIASAIVVPQTKPADARLVLTQGTGEGAKKFGTPRILDFELLAGKKYTYTITVKKIELSITAFNITDWDTESKGDKDATLTE